jgi:hypothetical protein
MDWSILVCAGFLDVFYAHEILLGPNDYCSRRGSSVDQSAFVFAHDDTLERAILKMEKTVMGNF